MRNLKFLPVLKGGPAVHAELYYNIFIWYYHFLPARRFGAQQKKMQGIMDTRTSGAFWDYTIFLIPVSLRLLSLNAISNGVVFSNSVLLRGEHEKKKKRKETFPSPLPINNERSLSNASFFGMVVI